MHGLPNIKFKHDVLEIIFCKNGKILLGQNGELPFLAPDNRKRSSSQNTACENTQDTGPCPQLAILQHATIQNIHTWFKKKVFDLALFFLFSFAHFIQRAFDGSEFEFQFLAF
jgi:hypothetical protein